MLLQESHRSARSVDRRRKIETDLLAGLITGLGLIEQDSGVMVQEVVKRDHVDLRR